MNENLETVGDVRARIDGNRFAMVTSIDERGTLSSRPVTIQDFDEAGDLWFLVDRNADWVGPLDGGPVNAAVSDDRTWVSFAGRAFVVDDAARVEELRDPTSDVYFDDGAKPVALQLVTDRIEWWASPNKAVQLIELVKAKVTSSEAHMGDSGTIET